MQELGPDLPAARESLGQLGEAGDVDERERAVDGTVWSGDPVAQPFDQHARDVRLEELVRVRLFTNWPEVVHHSVTRASRP